MKKTALVMLTCIFATVSFSQAAPSKSETIAYIKKRIEETSGYKLSWKSGIVEFIHDVFFSETLAYYENGKYNMRYTYKDNSWFHNNFEFKPEFITTVTEASDNVATNSSVGFIAINFSNSLVKKKVLYNNFDGGYYINEYAFTKTMNEDSNVSTVFLPYLKQDSTAFDRIKKAVMHLKEFYVTTDPFAN